MYHPTPYHWQTEAGLTHVFYDNHLPPSEGFGWSSLCNAVQIPIEGRHFELIEVVSEDTITCDQCRAHLDRLPDDLTDETLARVESCLVRFDRDEDGMLVRANRVCRGMLHHSLPFKPESFTGDLTEEVDEVCTECWGTYIEHQWTSDDMGAELRVEVLEEDGHSEYFAQRAEPIRRGNEAVLRMVSENGLVKDFHRDLIQSIRLTPARNINY